MPQATRLPLQLPQDHLGPLAEVPQPFGDLDRDGHQVERVGEGERGGRRRPWDVLGQLQEGEATVRHTL